MNVDEYRALKMQETQERQQTESQGVAVDVQAEQSATPVVEQGVSAQTQEQPASREGETEAAASAPTSTATPDRVEIDGQTYTLDELKGGLLRQSDYTRKTQEIAKERERLALAEQYFNAVNSKPEFAQELAESFNLPYKTPEQLSYDALQQEHQEALLRLEIATLSTKYSDFDADKVVALSLEKGMTNLEDAYHLSKAGTPANAQALDVKALTEQIRQSVLLELQSKVDTSTIISTGGDTSSIARTEPVLTAQETRVAAGLKMTPEEYLLYKNKR